MKREILKRRVLKLALGVGMWLLLFACYAAGAPREALVPCGLWAAFETIVYFSFPEPSDSMCPFCKRRIPEAATYCARCVNAPA